MWFMLWHGLAWGWSTQIGLGAGALFSSSFNNYIRDHRDVLDNHNTSLIEWLFVHSKSRHGSMCFVL
jgi:hypothetical protein